MKSGPTCAAWTGDELTVVAKIAHHGRFWSRQVGEVLGATTDLGVFCRVHRDGSTLR